MLEMTTEGLVKEGMNMSFEIEKLTRDEMGKERKTWDLKRAQQRSED